MLCFDQNLFAENIVEILLPKFDSFNLLCDRNGHSETFGSVSFAANQIKEFRHTLYMQAHNWKYDLKNLKTICVSFQYLKKCYEHSGHLLSVKYVQS